MTTGAAHTGSTDPSWRRAEREILKQLSEGERRNLGSLVDHYGEDLMRYLLSIMGRREAAEDVFQITWIKVMQHIHRFDQSRNFSPWLFRIARNSAYDRLRRRRWKRWLSLSRTDDEQPMLEIREPEDLQKNLMTKNLAHALLDELEPTLRELIHLRFFEGLSYEEIAAHCRIPMGTVKSRLARAMDQLAKKYQMMERSAYARTPGKL